MHLGCMHVARCWQSSNHPNLLVLVSASAARIWPVGHQLEEQGCAPQWLCFNTVCVLLLAVLQGLHMTHSSWVGLMDAARLFPLHPYAGP